MSDKYKTKYYEEAQKAIEFCKTKNVRDIVTYKEIAEVSGIPYIPYNPKNDKEHNIKAIRWNTFINTVKKGLKSSGLTLQVFTNGVSFVIASCTAEDLPKKITPISPSIPKKKDEKEKEKDILIANLKKDNERLYNECENLKEVIASQKTEVDDSSLKEIHESLCICKKQIKELKALVAHYSILVEDLL